MVCYYSLTCSVQYSHSLDVSVIYSYCLYYLLILCVFITDY